MCFVKWSKLAQPCWQADIVLWWRVHVFILADSSQLRADGTWLSGFTGGPPICLQWGLSPDNETGLLRKWSFEWKGQHKLIRQFISKSLMLHNGPVSDNLPYKAPQCGSKHLMSCTKLQIKRLALTVINHIDWDVRINYAAYAATLITSSLHPLIHLMYSLFCFPYCCKAVLKWNVCIIRTVSWFANCEISLYAPICESYNCFYLFQSNLGCAVHYCGITD